MKDRKDRTKSRKGTNSIGKEKWKDTESGIKDRKVRIMAERKKGKSKEKERKDTTYGV